MTDNPKYHKPKKFLNMPHVSGGKKELIKFIKENLQYPVEALEKKIQGDVIIKYKVNDNGEVIDPVIVKGIGHGCDQEAIRLVKMILYDPVKNRGARVTANQKIKIPFRLPGNKTKQPVKVVYTTDEENKKESPPNKDNKNKESDDGYIITINL